MAANPSELLAHGVLRPAPGVVARQLGDGAVLIRLQTNRIYELNATGARVWQLLSEGRPPREIAAVLRTEFAGAGSDSELAVAELIDALRAEGLL